MLPPLPDAPCKERHLHPYSASVPGYRESSIAQFPIQITPSADFLYSKISNSCLTQLVVPISALVSDLGRTAALIHFLLCLIRHIDQSKPIEHTIYMSHPGCHPELLTGQPPRRSFLHWTAPAAPTLSYFKSDIATSIIASTLFKGRQPPCNAVYSNQIKIFRGQSWQEETTKSSSLPAEAPASGGARHLL